MYIFRPKKRQKFVTGLIIEKERTTPSLTYMMLLPEFNCRRHLKIFINHIRNHFIAVVISGIIFGCKSGH